ncbi:hypothetical protein IFM89_015107 [Coptis chinensis]|uniref:Bromo domain-containing protein n=1 Tax=Coptis chinensis TaxID=261450 RepID=A0A835IMV3_9MAGN|nr:hypothetical protein IFM89_015107 [Coptis chinensis]
MVSASHSISLHSSSLQLIQPSSAMSTTCEKLAPRKLKIKLSKINSESEIISADYGHGIKGQFSLNCDKEKRKGNTPVEKEMGVSDRYDVQISVTHSSKRQAARKLENQKAKKLRLDSRLMHQCALILKKLMSHKKGWAFNTPVDPVAYGIPDYFTIITKPMDLGTIKSKLENSLYSNTDEFAADVRLTFSNAMLYNPPSNNFHIMAKELNYIFEVAWKANEAKWSAETFKVEQHPNSNERPTMNVDLRRDDRRQQQDPSPKIPNKVSIISIQKLKLRKDLVEISKEKSSPPFLEHFRKMGLIGQQDDRIEVDIDRFDEITVCKWQNAVRSYHRLKSAESSYTENSCGRDSVQKDLHKGIDNSTRHVVGVVSDKSRTISACSNGSYESVKYRDVDLDRPCGRDESDASHGGVQKLDLPVNGTAEKLVSKSDLEFNEGVSAVDEETAQPSSHLAVPGTAATSEEGWDTNNYDGQLSPSKALRAAMLRSRFADTIVKARQKTLLNNGEKSDPVKMKQEKERLEKQQRDEKARIEAQMRAAEAASRMKEEMDLKIQREKEREAARIALQKMERTVQIDENLEILKDLELLGGYSPVDCLDHNGNPLARLGLFMKVEYLEDEEELDTCNGVVVEELDTSNGDVEEELGTFNEDVEEGEIPL